MMPNNDYDPRKDSGRPTPKVVIQSPSDDGHSSSQGESNAKLERVKSEAQEGKQTENDFWAFMSDLWNSNELLAGTERARQV